MSLIKRWLIHALSGLGTSCCTASIFVRAVFTVVFVSLFTWYFLFHALYDWQPTYARFQVPAMTYPGGDSRNIQMASHCMRLGHEGVGLAACVKAGSIVRSVHPQASVPVYNYPPIWAHGYALLIQEGEEAFVIFWRWNALMLVTAIVVLCWHYALWCLPFLLLSPVTLLTIERGNIDGATFAVASMAVLFMRSRFWLPAGGLALATVMKVYPVFGLLTVLGAAKSADRLSAAIMGFAGFVPLMLWTAINMAEYVSGTSTGFPYSYGLLAITHAPAFPQGSGTVRWGVIAGITLIAIVVAALQSQRALVADVDARLRRMTAQDVLLLAMSLMVFVGTFLVFTNWAYRLIFIFPELLVALRQGGFVFWFFVLNAIAVLLGPLLPSRGWEAQTILCYPLAAVSMFLLFRIIVTVCVTARVKGCPIR